MGMFDWVKVTHPAFVCPDGHNLRDCSFQTKDFQCSLSTATIGERLDWTPSYIGAPLSKPFLGRVTVYTTCERCPAYIAEGYNGHAKRNIANTLEAWCEFEVEIVDDIVRSVKRVGPTLVEEVAEAKRKVLAVKGPMSRAEAARLMNDWHDRAHKARSGDPK